MGSCRFVDTSSTAGSGADLWKGLLQQRSAAVDLDVPGPVRSVERTLVLRVVTFELGDLLARGHLARRVRARRTAPIDARARSCVIRA